ncbi:MAG: DUF58 domain-containing protein [Mariprofundales bacterium]|nr:DUF58 domain-containing protein [Mariprofundales bacterium]
MIDSPTSTSIASLVALRRKAMTMRLLSGSICAPLAGGHSSRLRGRGMEFDEVRRYQPGDDAATIDWKVTARKGVPHTKLFHEERERPVLLCIDYRQAMFFATRGVLKAVLASRLSALYGWSAINHSDRVGALLFDDTRVWEQRPARGRRALLHLFYRCCNHPNWDYPLAPVASPLQFKQVLLHLRRVAHSGSLVVLVTDGRGLDQGAEAALAAVAQHNTMILILISDPIERNLPSGGNYPIHDGNGLVVINGDDAKLRQRYAQQFSDRYEAVRQISRRRGIHLLEISTDDDPFDLLATPNAR